MTDQIQNIPRHIALKIKAGWVAGLVLLFFKGLYLFAAVIASSENNNLYFLVHVIDFTVFAIIIYLIFLRVWMAAITAAIYIIYTILNFFYAIDTVYIPFIDIIITLLLLQSAWGIIQYKMLLNNPDKDHIIKESIEKEKYQETQYEEIDDLEDDYWMTEKQKSKKKSNE